MRPAGSNGESPHLSLSIVIDMQHQIQRNSRVAAKIYIYFIEVEGKTMNILVAGHHL